MFFFHCVLRLVRSIAQNWANVCVYGEQNAKMNHLIRGSSCDVDKCNVNSPHRNKCQCRNENSQKCENKIDKTNVKCIKMLSPTKCNRSQRFLEHNSIVQNSREYDTSHTIFHSKFAFHRLMNFMIILLFIACTTVNGQQQLDSRQKMQNTGECWATL